MIIAICDDDTGASLYPLRAKWTSARWIDRLKPGFQMGKKNTGVGTRDNSTQHMDVSKFHRDIDCQRFLDKVIATRNFGSLWDEFEALISQAV